MDELDHSGLTAKQISIGVIEVNTGDYFDFVFRNAAMLVLDQGIDAVGFIFNDKLHKITYEEAKKVCTPLHVWSEIRLCQHYSLEAEPERIAYLKNRYGENYNRTDSLDYLRKKMENYWRLGVKVYGQDFFNAEP